MKVLAQFFLVLRKGYWLPFLQAIKQYMDNAEFSGFFGEIWTQVESPNMNARVSLDTLVEWFKEADKSHLMILSRLVDTFISRISLSMPPIPKSHNTACVLS